MSADRKARGALGWRVNLENRGDGSTKAIRKAEKQDEMKGGLVVSVVCHFTIDELRQPSK